MYESIISILNAVKSEMIKQYQAKGLKASGKFPDLMTVARQGRFKVVLTLPFYSEFITKFKSNKGGVKPGGRFPNIDNLIQWLKDKKLPLRNFKTGQFTARTPEALKRTAFLIGRKIKEKGTDIHLKKRQPIDLDAIINDRLDFAGNELADRILQEIKIEP